MNILVRIIEICESTAGKCESVRESEEKKRGQWGRESQNANPAWKRDEILTSRLLQRLEVGQKRERERKKKRKNRERLLDSVCVMGFFQSCHAWESIAIKLSHCTAHDLTAQGRPAFLNTPAASYSCCHGCWEEVRICFGSVSGYTNWTWRSMVWWRQRPTGSRIATLCCLHNADIDDMFWGSASQISDLMTPLIKAGLKNESHLWMLKFKWSCRPIKVELSLGSVCF